VLAIQKSVPFELTSSVLCALLLIKKQQRRSSINPCNPLAFKQKYSCQRYKKHSTFIPKDKLFTNPCEQRALLGVVVPYLYQ
jgi:hypothetical protein